MQKIYQNLSNIWLIARIEIYKCIYVRFKLRQFHSNAKSEQLNASGFIEWNKFELYDYVLEQYSGGREIRFNQLRDESKADGFTFCAIPFDNLKLMRAIFNDELYDILYGYFKKKFYVRGNIQFVLYDGIYDNGTENFHIDRDYVVNLMINLTEVTNQTTRMEFLDAKEVVNLNDLGAVEEGKLHSTIGGAGHSFLFTAGRNHHRRVSGGMRAVLILNFLPVKPSCAPPDKKIIGGRNDFDCFITKRNKIFDEFINSSGKWRRDQFRIIEC